MYKCIRRFFSSLMLSIVSTSSFAFADVGDIIEKYVPDTHIVGKGRAGMLMWDVYDATLYASKGEWHSNKPYALSISYLRDVSGGALAKFSLEEIKRVRCADRKQEIQWMALMKDIFPDVQKGTVLTGIRNHDGSTIFFEGKNLIGSVQDPAFGDCFFSIWLGESTAKKTLRLKLLGLTE